MEKTKTTKQGDRLYTYWMASWREGGKVRNVHIGSTRKLSSKEALQKARALKSSALGLNGKT
jgi:hypothetical protein